MRRWRAFAAFAVAGIALVLLDYDAVQRFLANQRFAYSLDGGYGPLVNQREPLEPSVANRLGGPVDGHEVSGVAPASWEGSVRPRCCFRSCRGSPTRCIVARICELRRAIRSSSGLLRWPRLCRRCRRLQSMLFPLAALAFGIGAIHCWCMWPWRCCSCGGSPSPSRLTAMRSCCSNCWD